MKKLFSSVFVFATVFNLNAFAQIKDQPMDTYRRSSITMIMLEDPYLKPDIAALVKESFVGNPIPDKFDDHGLPANLKTFNPTTVTISDEDRQEYNELSGDKKQSKTKKGGGAFGGFAKALLELGPTKEEYRNPTTDTVKKNAPYAAYSYLKNNKIAKLSMDKWLGAEDGELDTHLIVERAFFNATEEEKQAAKEKYSERDIKTAIMDIGGWDMLNNTFVTVSRFRYMNAADMSAEILNKAAITAQYMPRNLADEVMSAAEIAADAATIAIGDGYCIYTTTYLYKLDWNEEIKAAIFDAVGDINKYNSLDCFKLSMIGEESAYAQIAARKRTPEEAVKYATTRSIEKVIAKLERKYEVFRTKTPLTQIEPSITASIGTKECVEKGDKYEVLESVLDSKTGMINYKRIGVITVETVGNNMGDDNDIEGASTDTFTTFKGDLSKKAHVGSLIRQIN